MIINYSLESLKAIKCHNTLQLGFDHSTLKLLMRHLHWSIGILSNKTVEMGEVGESTWSPASSRWLQVAWVSAEVWTYQIHLTCRQIFCCLNLKHRKVLPGQWSQCNLALERGPALPPLGTYKIPYLYFTFSALNYVRQICNTNTCVCIYSDIGE